MLPKKTNKNSYKKEIKIYKNCIDRTSIYTNDEIELANLQNESYKFMNSALTIDDMDGELAFKTLASWLFLDLSSNHAVSPALLNFVVTTASLYLHNSSYAPMVGYGKVQEREKAQMLKYYRSQDNTPARIFYNKVLNTSRGSRKSYLLQNQKVRQLYEDCIPEEIFKNIFYHVDEYGYKKKESKVKNFGLLLAYSGLRLNNYDVMRIALETYCQDQNATELADVLSKIPLFKVFSSSKLPKEIKQLSLGTIKNRIGAMQKFYANKNANQIKFTNLQSLMMEERTTVIRRIVKGLPKLKSILVSHPSQSTVLHIKLYPNFNDSIRDSRNYCEGITNTIIGFFGGLINYLSRSQGYYYRCERRQSFGFLQTTITDINSMEFRLSLGLEPVEFADVIIKSLVELDQLLLDYDLTQGKKSRIKIVKACFQTCEKSQGENPSDRTGNYFLASMRSDQNKWLSLRVAQNCLEETDDQRDSHIITAAFERYLQDFILGENQCNAEIEDTAPRGVKYSKGTVKTESVIFKLLQNLLIYTEEMLSKPVVTQFSAVYDNLLRSYWHILWQLSKYYHRGLGILNNADKSSLSLLFIQACSTIESLLEYHNALQTLLYVDSLLNQQQDKNIHLLKETYTSYLKNQFHLRDDQVAIYHTDNGQQANNVAMLIINQQVLNNIYRHNHSGHCIKIAIPDETIYVDDNCYYETALFLKQILLSRNYNKSSAFIYFLDITSLNDFEIKKFPKLKALIIDITHQGGLKNPELNRIVESLLNQGIYVLFTESLLKHGELGLDKYQVGRISLLQPKGLPLDRELLADLQEIEQQALPIPVARFLNLTLDIFNEQYQKPTVTNSYSLYGLFRDSAQKNIIDDDNNFVQSKKLR